MNVTAVESTTLATVAYDGTQNLLQLEFCSQAIYQYFGVPASVHKDLLLAPSKGRYFNQAVRGRFPYRLVSYHNAEMPDAEVRAECRGQE
jgi:hypothetical protein